MSRGDNPAIRAKSSGAAEALKYMLLEYPEQFRLQFQGDVSDFIQEQASRPMRCATAPVKAPRSCPKSSLSSKPAGMAAQFTTTNGSLRRRLI